jgi:hypothetical protein
MVAAGASRAFARARHPGRASSPRYADGDLLEILLGGLCYCLYVVLACATRVVWATGVLVSSGKFHQWYESDLT